MWFSNVLLTFDCWKFWTCSYDAGFCSSTDFQVVANTEHHSMIYVYMCSFLIKQTLLGLIYLLRNYFAGLCWFLLCNSSVPVVCLAQDKCWHRKKKSSQTAICSRPWIAWSLTCKKGSSISASLKILHPFCSNRLLLSETFSSVALS